MKALACLNPGELALQDRPSPGRPPAGWASVAVSHVGICGTDFHIYEGSHPYLAYPRVMGHEISGSVSSVGDGVAVAIGETVIVNPYVACGRCGACRQGKPNCCVRLEVLGVHRDGAMCEEILVPAANLYPAGGLSLEQAATVEFLAIGAHAVRRSLAGEGSRALVIGAGPIGLGAAIFSRIAGHEVSVLDVSRPRLDFAETELGFKAIDPGSRSADEAVREQSGGDGFDVVFDATGSSSSIRSAFAHVAHGGALVMVSVVKDDISFSDPEFHKREMMLIGSRNALRIDFDHVARSIRDGAVPLAKLITHRTTLREALRDIPRWARDKTGLIKAVIEVGG